MKKKQQAEGIQTSSKLAKLLEKENYRKDEIHLRLHRAISWYKASEQYEKDEDLKFIVLWISLNACYANDILHELEETKKSQEATHLKSFLDRLIVHDNEARIYNLLWNRFSHEIRLILENEFIFKPFWDFQRGDIKNYKESFKLSVDKANRLLMKKDVGAFLMLFLNRLYTLRNQIFHGGATYKGRVNRQQVKDASSILGRLIPIIIEIMVINKEENWGKVYYPVINASSKL